MIENTLSNRDKLFAEIKAGAIVVTPNNRLSLQLRQDFFNKTTADILDKPRCLPYQTFLHHLLKEFRHQHARIEHPILLTAAQQHFIWRQILQNEYEHPVTEGLLQAVKEAWKRCQYWQIDFHHPAFAETPQTYLFQQWQCRFQQKLDELCAITDELISPYIQTYPTVFSFSKVIWACFDDYTPQQRELQQFFSEQHCSQWRYEIASKVPTTKLYEAKDQQDEFLQIMLWLKERLTAKETRIAVVVPDLEAQSAYIQRLLTKHLQSDMFNISLGKPLSAYPIILHALKWLSLNHDTLTHEQIKLLLHSPYLKGAKTEILARASLLQERKILQEDFISFSTLTAECRTTAPVFYSLLLQMTPYPAQASPWEWAELFKTRLQQLGFPGEYALNSAVYQSFQRLEGLFDELLQIASITPHLSQKEALDILSHLAESTIFQVRQPTTPIQVMGLLEASGCMFDSIWVCGLTDQCLPQKVKLSAFIPIELQRGLDMPHARPERELQFATQLLSRFQNSSQECIFSYSRIQEDRPNLPSPLVNHISAWIPFNNTCSSRPPLEQLNESYIIPFQNEKATGHTALLSYQAQCPFKAFSAFRLHAKEDPLQVMGLDVRERGQILHQVMEKLWQALGCQQKLLTLEQKKLEALIHSTIEQVLVAMVPINRHSFPPLIREVELTRLKTIVVACLEWEKQRPSFEVEALEQTYFIHLSGLDFKVRIDRMDKIGDKKWVIDYKSTLPDSSPWNDERPEHPQLLLYALLDEEINTLLFLELKTGRLTCSGLSEEITSVQGVRTLKKEEKWREYQEQWSQRIALLAAEFHEGHCAPKPLRKSLCQRCEFQSLCRMPPS